MWLPQNDRIFDLFFVQPTNLLMIASSKPVSILFIANSAYFLKHYYEHLLTFFVSSGYRVSIIVPMDNNTTEYDFPTDCATYLLPFFHAYQFNGFKQFKLHRELKRYFWKLIRRPFFLLLSKYPLPLPSFAGHYTYHSFQLSQDWDFYLCTIKSSPTCQVFF